MTSQNTGIKLCVITSEDQCEEKRVCARVSMSMRAFHDGKKILNQLRISLAPSALFVLLIRVLCSAASPNSTGLIQQRSHDQKYENAVYVLPPLTIYIPDTIFVYLSCISLLLTYFNLFFMKKYALYEVYIFPRSVQLPVIHEFPAQMPQVFLLLHEIKTLSHIHAFCHQNST